MNAPAQILTALGVVFAAAVMPISGLFRHEDNLREIAGKKAGTEKSSAAATAGSRSTAEKLPNDGGPPDRSSEERIPPGVSAADAAGTIAEIAALDGKMPSSRRILALMEKVMSLPESHLEKARAVIEASKNPVMGMMLYAGLFSRWGELNPENAHAALESSSGPVANPIFKMAGAASLASGWMEKNPDDFLKWANDSGKGVSAKDKELRSNMLEAVFHMTPIDSATAEKIIAASPKDRRAWMILDMAEQDPSMNPRDVAVRALAEAGENQRNSVQWRIGRMLAERDPQDAIKYAEEQQPGERKQTYEAALSSWVRSDQTAAMKWLKGQPEEVQTDAIGGLRNRMDDMSYDEVEKLSGDMSKGAASQLWLMALSENANRNPEEALRYLPNVSDERRPYGYGEIAQGWAKKDPEAASEWVKTLPDGNEKDHAIDGMVREIRSKEPDSSTIWASTVSDEAMRGRLVTDSARTWLKRDPAAAEEWIHATDAISQEQKDKILESRPK